VKTKPSEFWVESLALAEAVVAAHRELVAASDTLAVHINIKPDYVLGKVMPLKASARRESSCVLDFVTSHRNWIESTYEAAVLEAERKTAKATLLSKLQLTAEQKRLLGIEDGEVAK